MTNDKVTEILIDALKQCLADPGEQLLVKSGKLDGLFAGRTGANGEAADQALREGLLEVVRTETKGKTTLEWVRATPKAVEFLHEHESPIRTLRDLQAILQTNRAAVPLWLAEMQRDLQGLQTRLADEAERWTHRLEALGQQVEQALQRFESNLPELSDSAAADAPWAAEALAYLERRRLAGAAGDCSLPELFAVLHERHPELSLPHFHDRLRRLHDHRALRLVQFAGAANEIPEPEYALPDGASLLYYVAR
jgi:hypothetical protein